MRKGLYKHDFGVLWLFLLALIVVSLAAEAKDVEPLEAVKIAQRYVRLPEETVVKMQARKRLYKTNAPYYIFGLSVKKRPEIGVKSV